MLEQPHAERWELRLRGETTNDKGNNDDVIVMTEENMACEWSSRKKFDMIVSTWTSPKVPRIYDKKKTVLSMNDAEIDAERMVYSHPEGWNSTIFSFYMYTGSME